jgi:hypothetical protein
MSVAINMPVIPGVTARELTKMEDNIALKLAAEIPDFDPVLFRRVFRVTTRVLVEKGLKIKTDGRGGWTIAR